MTDEVEDTIAAIRLHLADPDFVAACSATGGQAQWEKAAEDYAGGFDPAPRRSLLDPAYNSEHGARLVQVARRRKDWPADKALRAKAREIILAGKPLPAALAEYIANGPLADDWKPIDRRHGSPLKGRNSFLLEAIQLAEDRGFKASRNRETSDRECAFTLVAEALSRDCIWEITPSTLEEIWRNRPKASGPGLI